MKFIYYVRTPLPPFHWVLSLSRGLSKFNSVLKYYPVICPLHQIQHEVIQATACDKYFVTFDNIALVKSVVQYTPPLLNDPKSALHILANTLDVR